MLVTYFRLNGPWGELALGGKLAVLDGLWKSYWNRGFGMVLPVGTPPVPGLVTLIVDCMVMSGRQAPDGSDQSQYGSLTCSAAAVYVAEAGPVNWAAIITARRYKACYIHHINVISGLH